MGNRLHVSGGLMKIRKLYLKIFFAFLAVLIAAELVVFSFILSHKLPPPLIRNIVQRATLTSQLITREIEGPPSSLDTTREKLNSLITLVAKSFRGKVWITNANGTVVATTVRGKLPEFKDELQPVPLPPRDTVKLFVIQEHRSRSIYLESPIRLSDGTELTVHVLKDRHRRKEEEWFLHGLLLLTVLSAVIIIPVTRMITRPILKLSETADRLGQGDFSQRVPEKGHDEVSVLAKKFNRMADRLEKMVMTGKELTAHLSHELRTPLARMRISLQMIMERKEAGKETDDTKLLNKIKNEIENMDTLIGRILDLSKLDMQEPPPRSDRVDMGEFLHSLIDKFGPMIEQRAISLRTSISDVPEYLCHDHAINVLMENVLGNAIKYTDNNGSITVALFDESNALHIRICNTHPPMAEKDLTDMFIPFHRLDKGKEAGTGLGLAAAQKIVRIHEGTIAASYESDQVCIKIVLPLNE